MARISSVAAVSSSQVVGLSTKSSHQQSCRYSNNFSITERAQIQAAIFQQTKLCGYSITTRLYEPSTRGLYKKITERKSKEKIRDESPMSCLTTRFKLITLCCFVTLVAIISSAMVINAFLNWSPSRPNIKTEKVITMPDNTHIDSNNIDPLIPPNANGLDMQIKINEITTSPFESTEARRKWFELQKYNTPNRIEDGTFDIDDEDVEEMSGSGSDGNESPVTIVPLPTRINSPRPNETGTQIVRVDNPIIENLRYNTIVDSSQGEHTPVKSTTPSIFIDTTTTSKPTSKSTSASTTSASTAKRPGEDVDFSFPGAEQNHLDIIEGVSSYHIGSPVTPSNLPDEDKCERWLRCEDPFLTSYVEKFALLPTCPCAYPLDQGNDVYDLYHKKVFSWRDSEYSRSYLFAYHKGATKCIRSEVGAGTLAAQNCCYDKQNLLLTRGSGAGTPDVISPDVSEALHKLVDKVPWILCKGDWTKYNLARPPNNMRLCPKNPPQMEYLYQIWLVKNQ